MARCARFAKNLRGDALAVELQASGLVVLDNSSSVGKKSVKSVRSAHTLPDGTDRGN